MKKITIKLFLAVMMVIQMSSLGLLAASQAEAAVDFGKFETDIFGTDKKVEGTTFTFLIGTIFKYVAALIVMAGLIGIVIAGYIYMTAGGNSGRVTLAKSIIGTSLLGIFLALASVLLLNVISSQFTSNLEPPGLHSGGGSGAAIPLPPIAPAPALTSLDPPLGRSQDIEPAEFEVRFKNIMDSSLSNADKRNKLQQNLRAIDLHDNHWQAEISSAESYLSGRTSSTRTLAQAQRDLENAQRKREQYTPIRQKFSDQIDKL